MNYYRKFIRNVYDLCAPLFELLKKGKEFCWGRDQKVAFETLKKALVEPSVLQQPDFTKDFILETDASNYGLGAILSQEFNGKELPVAYASRTLVAAEKNYGIRS